MEHIDISKLFSNVSDYVNRTVTVCGWVKTSAEVKPMTFIQLNDGTTTIKNLQLTIHQDKMSEEEYKSVIKPLLNFGVSLKATGVIVPSERNIIELEVDSVEMLGDCPSSYPLQKKKTSVDFLRTIPHLRTRTNLMKAGLTIRSRLAFAVHSYFTNNGYTYVHTPIITDSDCEGAGEMFRVTTQPWNASYPSEEEYYRDDYFGQKAGLSVSCQLEGEMAAVGGLGKIYTFGPSFRAEKSDTPRHVAEFWHVEPEVCFADINEIMDIGEEFIKYVKELHEKGTIRHIGLSTHNPVIGKLAVESGFIEMILFSINPAFDMRPATEDLESMFGGYENQEWSGIDPERARFYQMCEENNVGLTVMKGFFGGALLDKERSPFDVAFTPVQLIHYALTRPGACSILCGYDTTEQIDAAVAYETASEDEKDYASVIANAPMHSYNGTCTYCGHCKPCPMDIDIAMVNKFYDLAMTQEKVPESVAEHYKALGHTASECIGCQSCESRCPFGVEISSRMTKTAELFGI